MNVITKQQLHTRWDSIPDILREAITSETNSQFVWKTAVGEHLPDQKAAVVSKLTGFVLMGFIHPEELAAEIKKELGIDARIAAAIAEPLNRKIFQPLREELEQIYAAPLSEAEEAASATGRGAPEPVMMEEIAAPQKSASASVAEKTAMPVPPMPPISKPPVQPAAPSNKVEVPQPKTKVIPPVPPSAPPAAPPAAEAPKPEATQTKPEADSTGSRPAGAAPQVAQQKFSPFSYPRQKTDLSSLNAFGQFKKPLPTKPVAPPAEKPATQSSPGSPAPAATVPAAPPKIEPSAPAPSNYGSSAPIVEHIVKTKPGAPSVEAPFMLHQESEFQPAVPAAQPGFKLSLSEEQFGKMEQKWTASPKPAQIETSVPEIKPVPPEPRVVHYSDMKTPLTPEPKKPESPPRGEHIEPVVPPLPSPPLPQQNNQ